LIEKSEWWEDRVKEKYMKRETQRQEVEGERWLNICSRY
jgi:hypothetical protein